MRHLPESDSPKNDIFSGMLKETIKKKKKKHFPGGNETPHRKYL